MPWPAKVRSDRDMCGATSAANATSSTAPRIDSRSVPTRGARRAETMRPARSLAWGRISSTRYRKMIGSAGRILLSMSVGSFQIVYDSASPSASPPANVHGRLLRRPTIAAAYPLMTSNVSRMMSSDTSGASRIPARPASDAPRAQLTARTRSGSAPVSAASSGSSTTARMAMPICVRVNSRRRNAATMAATLIMVSW